MAVDIDTPIADIINQRPQMIALAQRVFDLPDLKLIKAFSGFTDLADLGRIIEAKRKNVFDYGVTVSIKNNNAKYPPPVATLRALDLALEGNYEAIDLRSLGLVDENNEVLTGELVKLCPSYEPSKAPKKSALKKEPEVEAVRAQQEVEPTQVPEPEPPTELVRVAPAVRTSARETPDASHDLSVLMGRLDELSNGIADGFGRHLAATQAHVDARNRELSQRIDAAFARVSDELSLINENLRTVLSYLDPDGAAALPAIVRPAVSDTVTSVARAAEAVNETMASPYSREQIDSMDLPDLQALAQEIGIDSAGVRFRPLLAKKIKERLGL